jgi:hypothetical protein
VHTFPVAYSKYKNNLPNLREDYRQINNVFFWNTIEDLIYRFTQCKCISHIYVWLVYSWLCCRNLLFLSMKFRFSRINAYLVSAKFAIFKIQNFLIHFNLPWYHICRTLFNVALYYDTTSKEILYFLLVYRTIGNIEYIVFIYCIIWLIANCNRLHVTVNICV